MAEKPGYWKNYASCSTSNGHQFENARSKVPPWCTVNDFINDPTTTAVESDQLSISCSPTVKVDFSTCVRAVMTLQVRNSLTKGGSLASDALRNLAKHYLAYKLNVRCGVVDCTTTTFVGAVQKAEELLCEHFFVVESAAKPPYLGDSKSQDYKDALDAASILDAFNNNCNNACGDLSCPP